MLRYFQDDDEGVPTPPEIADGPLIFGKKTPLLKSMSQKSMIIPGPGFFYSPKFSNSSKVGIKKSTLIINY